MSDENADEAVEAVDLINKSAMNMLKQIEKETERGGLSTAKIKDYSFALGKIKNEILDIKSVNATTGKIELIIN